MSNHPFRLEDLFLTRREFLHQCGMGLGALGFASLMQSVGLAAPAEANSTWPLKPRSPQFPAKAKRVIHFL